MTTIGSALLPGTEVRTITAHSIKQEYRISVALPRVYGTHIPSRFTGSSFLAPASLTESGPPRHWSEPPCVARDCSFLASMSSCECSINANHAKNRHDL